MTARRHSPRTRPRRIATGIELVLNLKIVGFLAPAGRWSEIASELVTDIIRSLSDGGTSAELQRDDRGIILTLRGNMLETVNTIEGVLKGLGDVGLDIRGAGTGIGGDEP